MKPMMPVSLIMTIITASVKVCGWIYDLIMAAINKDKETKKIEPPKF